MEKSNIKRKSSEIDEIKENANKKIDVTVKEKTEEENKNIKNQSVSEEEKKEEHYVHDVYEAIAPHFSDTRYKVMNNENLKFWKYNWLLKTLNYT